MPKRSPSWLFPLLAICGTLGCGFWLWQKTGAPKPEKSPPPSSQNSASAAGDPSHSWKPKLDEALLEENPGSRSASFGRNLRAWFHADPEGALAYLRTLPPGNEYTSGLLIVLGGIAEKDPERALRLAGEMAQRSEEWILYNALFADFAKGDLNEAQALLALVPAGQPLERATRALLTVWAEEDFSSAWFWSLSQAPPDARSTAIEAALAVQARFQPADSFLLAQENLSGKARDRILLESLRELIARDPHQASGLVSQLPDGELRDQSVLNVVRALAVNQPDDVVSWLKGFEDDRLHDLACNNLLDVWSKSDPVAAMNFVAALPPGARLNFAAAQLADNLGRSDEKATFAWAESLPTPEARHAAWLSLASSWARREPEQAVQWTTSFPEDVPIREEALQAAFSYWSLVDPRSASDFVTQLSESEQPHAINSVAHPLTQQDTSSALAWAQSFENEDLQILATDAVIRSWSQTAPQEAGTWVANQPESTARIDLARAITENWYPKDPSASQAWVESLSPGPTRDGALDMLVSQIAPTDFSTALALASTIDSAPLREARTTQLKHTYQP